MGDEVGASLGAALGAVVGDGVNGVDLQLLSSVVLGWAQNIYSSLCFSVGRLLSNKRT